jgi:hypothetical protein
MRRLFNQQIRSLAAVRTFYNFWFRHLEADRNLTLRLSIQIRLAVNHHPKVRVVQGGLWIAEDYPVQGIKELNL